MSLSGSSEVPFLGIQLWPREEVGPPPSCTCRAVFRNLVRMSARYVSYVDLVDTAEF